MADARRLKKRFAGIVSDRERFDGWLEEAETSEATAMRRFAAGLGKDLLAACAGPTKSWSNGPIEGFVKKSKLLKRQGYGRAGFDLLRARVPAA